MEEEKKRARRRRKKKGKKEESPEKEEQKEEKPEKEEQKEEKPEKEEQKEEKPEKEEQKEVQKKQEEEDILEDEVNLKEVINKKCSLDEHKDIDAEYYCQECKISMCKKCEKDHSRLLKNHHLIPLDKDISEVFTGLCTKPKHPLALEYYCKTHNQLCCAACVSKVKNKWNGQHKDCEIYYIVKIKNSQKEKFDNNVKKLEELSNKIEPTIKQLKDIYEKINESKDKLKGEIQKIFTKIRTELNNREDKLYEEIEAKYNEIYFKEELIKESEKLPNLVKISLEKAKIKENDWDDENILPKLINDSINIENIIKNIDGIYGKVNDCISKKSIFIKFNLNKDKIEKGLLSDIKSFGKIITKDDEKVEEESDDEDEDENDIGLKGLFKQK